jgi:presenilin-like A22 family membrane protease
MTDIALIVLGSTVAAIIGIALGVMLPAIAMGKAFDFAYFVYWFGHDRITGHLLPRDYSDCALQKPVT